MSGGATVQLEDRTVLSVSGPEAASFLQGLVTNDIEQLTETNPLYAALLTPQGKILFDFLMFKSGDTIFVDCATGVRDVLQKRLSMYRLRAKIEIKPRDDLGVVASRGGMGLNAPPDPRFAKLGQRTVLAQNEISWPQGAARYLAHRLDLGVPEGPDFGQDKIFALDGGLDELHAVAFAKGCYVGQELTARMKHRGTARKRLMPVASVGGDMLPSPDSTLSAKGRDLGNLTSVYGSRGFALIRLDRLEEAGDATIEAAGIRVIVTKPEWLSA